MPVILGIDAAWTQTGSSGVALLEMNGGRPEIIASAPSYAAFRRLKKRGHAPFDREPGCPLDVAIILRKAEQLAGAPVDLVAVDMPMSRNEFNGRRTADNAVSREFGKYWAGVHSPTKDRPGQLGKIMTDKFLSAGFTLATSHHQPLPAKALVEVFPLAALVQLLRPKSTRPAYKVGKLSRTRRQKKVVDPRGELLDTWRVIVRALKEEIDLTFDVPDAAAVETDAELKPREDVLDAIVCAWVGARILKREATAWGCEDAAIWIANEIEPT